MHRATLLGRYEDRDLDPPKVRFRRAVTLALMSAFVPGSAQVALGRPWIRRLVLAGWFLLAVIVGYLVYRVYTDTAGLLLTFVSGRRLQMLQLGIIVAVAVWALLLLHAWRLGRPEGLRTGPRITVGLLNLALILGVGAVSAYAVYWVEAPRSTITQTFSGNEKSAPIEGRYNVLLLGSDSGEGREGMRPDAITMVSTDADTGDTQLISLPRNLQNFEFADGSPMAEQFPNGFNCGAECMLNAVNTYGEAHPDLYPGSDAPGIDATIDAIQGITGLEVNYYIVINMDGFAKLVDALGGLEINVQDRVAIGGGSSPIVGWIEPGVQDLNGDEVMWFTRSRAGSDDYARMGRQKCVLLAMNEQLEPSQVVTNVHEILSAGSEMLHTNIPEDDLSTFIQLGLQAQDGNVGSVSFVPPEINTTYPDLELIRDKVEVAINARPDESDGSDAPSPSPDSPETSTPEDSEPEIIVFGPAVPGGSDDSGLPQARQANNAEDLETVC